MDVRQLKYFVATAEAGQVSRASADLSISQSSVTAAIRQLEEETGVVLFRRVAGGMDLTEAGRELLGTARDILSRIEDARRLRVRHAAVTGRIALAATYTVMGYFLPAHLERLSRILPGLDVEPVEMHRESIEEGLLSNRFDLAVLLTSNITNPEIAFETLFRSTRRLWVPHNHRLDRKGHVSLGEIAEEDYIMLTVDEAANTSMRYWGMAGVRPRVKLRTASTEAVRSMVANGQGVTILSDMVYRPWSLEGKRIGQLSTDPAVPTMDVGLAWRRGRPLTDAAASIYDYFRRAYLSP